MKKKEKAGIEYETLEWLVSKNDLPGIKWDTFIKKTTHSHWLNEILLLEWM